MGGRGGGRVGCGGGQSGCERRNEVFEKIHQKIGGGGEVVQGVFGLGGVRVGGGSGWM